jgi:tRNA(Arg) A34 adenosine deaminase TadA
MDPIFMQRALELARDAIGKPGMLPYAAVVVRDGAIIGEGVNRSRERLDPTSHGEIEAVKAACKALGTTRLDGAELYTSCEPCAMCVATMMLAGIERFYYAASLADSTAMYARLVAHDPAWTRRIEPLELARQVALPPGERMMQGLPLNSRDGAAVLNAFARHVIEG